MDRGPRARVLPPRSHRAQQPPCKSCERLLCTLPSRTINTLASRNLHTLFVSFPALHIPSKTLPVNIPLRVKLYIRSAPAEQQENSKEKDTTLQARGQLVQGVASPGRDAKERNTTLSCFEQKSSVARKLRFRVLLFTVSTTGTFQRSFQKAQVPPAVDANSTTPLYFPCSFSWCSTTNCKSRTSSRTSPSWIFLERPI